MTICIAAAAMGMYYLDKYWNKADYRIPTESGYQWVMRSLGNRTYCYQNYRMHRNVFDLLHNVLVESYGLTSTRRMSSVETLDFFLWMCGTPQGMRQAEDRLFRSKETLSRKFEKVLNCLNKLVVDNIRPLDPEFTTIHPRLQSRRFSPYFDNCIGAIDGTHIPVVVPANQVVQHTGRKGYTSQNVLAICDFNMRFTFVVAGWHGSVHDMRVFKDAVDKYGNKFPHPPQVNGTFHLFECPVVHEMRDNECVCLQASFILWIRDIPTGRVIWRRIEVQSTIFLSFSKVLCQEVKKRFSILHTLRLGM